MKKLIIILLITGIWGCTTQDYVVQSDTAPEVDFDQFETFAFSNHARGDEAMYTLNDLELKVNIRDAIEQEMQAKGYRMVRQNPDLLVNFRVFEEETEIVGYEEESGTYWNDNEVRELDERTTYQLDKGSLVIDIADAETGAVVWKGYASGIIEENQFDRSERSIATAVEMIFDQYQFTGKRP